MTDQNDSLDEMYGEMQVRWYQAAAKNQVESALLKGIKRILVHSPTGSGKTITSGLIFSSPVVRKALGVPADRKLNLLFIAHKNRLLTQAERAYADANNVNFIPQSAFSAIPDDVEWDVCCLDEAHHEAMVTLQYQLEKLGDKPIIGLTATPDRADGCLIKFEEIVSPISREQAVAEGWLAETYIHSFVGAADRNKAPMIIDMLTRYAGQMEKAMVFMRTKAESRVITQWLTDSGYSAINIDAQSDAEVDTILDDFGTGKYQFVVNCNKISEGVDVPECTDIVLGRTVASYPLLNQIIGRAARPNSDCHVWEIINPLSGTNLDTTVVVGTPKQHDLIYNENGKWVVESFDYNDNSRMIFGSNISAQWAT